MLLLGPPVAWAVWWGLLLHGRAQTEQETRSPAGLVWETPAGRLTASLRVADEGERQRLLLVFTDSLGAPQYRREFLIDWDLGGGGLLAAMQADADPEPEIVYATRARPDAARYLDLSSGRVEEKPLSAAAPAARERVDAWLDSHVLNPVALGFWFLLTLAYYVFYGPAIWIGTWAARRRTRAGRDLPR